jgi:hypothetical protein
LRRFQYNSWDESQPPQQDEENPHFVGRFARATLRGFAYNSWDESQPPQLDEETLHFVGRFSPVKFTKGFIYQAWEIEPSPAQVIQPETNINFIGRFSPAKLSAFAWNSWDESQTAADEENPHFIGRFHAALLRQPINSWDESQTAVDEENPHFVGRFTAPILRSFRYGSWDESQTAVDRENPHFIARFTPVRLQPAVRSWDHSQTAVDEENPHFIGRFKIWPLSVFEYSSKAEAGAFRILPPLNVLNAVVERLASGTTLRRTRAAPPVRQASANVVRKAGAPVVRLLGAGSKLARCTENFSDANPGESSIYSLSFADWLASGETITSPSWSIQVVSGYDPDPNSRLIGQPSIDSTGTISSQLAGNMIAGVEYRLTCVATTSLGQIVPLYSHVHCTALQ